jgi:cell division septation protein DedD
MARAGRTDGGRLGRRGARVGLPRDSVSRDPGYRDARPEAGPVAPRHDPISRNRPRAYPAPPPPPIDTGWPDDAGRDRAEAHHDARLAVARLFDHLDRDTPRPYREDAYQDAPRIAHSGRVRFALSGGSISALIAGGLVSLFLIFVAGFMSAVVIFGEPDPDGQIAIRTAPQDGGVTETAIPDSAPAPSETRPTIAAPSRDGESVVSTAEAERGVLPPPSPEIVAVEAVRNQGNAVGPSPETAPTPPVDRTELAAAPPSDIPPSGQTIEPPPPGPADRGGLEPTGRVDTSIIFPPDKPPPPSRVVAAEPAAPGRLGPPGGNYSLQFGAFQARENAEALLRELSGAIEAGIVEETGATGATLYHVRAGAFETRAEALRVVRALRDDSGFVTFVHVNRVTG